MTEELKTLKDMEPFNMEPFIMYDRESQKGKLKVDIDELRAEAIKWFNYFHSNALDMTDEELKQVAPLQLWIIKFFNLTEEDLK